MSPKGLRPAAPLPGKHGRASGNMTDIMREAVTEREWAAFAIRPIPHLRAHASGTARAIRSHMRRTRSPNHPQMHRLATRTLVGTRFIALPAAKSPTNPMTAVAPAAGQG